MKHLYLSLSILLLLFFVGVGVGCGPKLDPLPNVSLKDRQSAVTSNNQFAFDLYREFAKGHDNSVFFSPHSISSALAMTWSGARGETEKEMKKVLHFSLDQNLLHPAFSWLNIDLNNRGRYGHYQLNVANRLWGQHNYKFLDSFIKNLNSYYKAGFEKVDFKADNEATRKKINGWVEQKTNGKIKDLVESGTLKKNTVLALVNAIYFKGSWLEQFSPKMTKEKDFFISADEKVKVQMMSSERKILYLNEGELKVISLPYQNDELSLVLLLPTLGSLQSFEKSVSASQIDRWFGKLKKVKAYFSLPKFKIETGYHLAQPLIRLGMKAAFVAGKANFSGADGSRELYLNAVLHQASIDVNEEGTEAAAATSVGFAGAPSVSDILTVQVDHPFLFMIRDNTTGNILFLGRFTGEK